MYPRNAASPERISIGAVVQISDGAVQTSGVSVKVLPQGGTASASGGTVAYEEGIVHYVPTQAETNVASFVLIAYKTGCIPATVTVVTSASATTGYAGLDWAKVSAPTTTLNLSGTTISTAQKVDIETIKTQAVTAAAGVTFPTSVASPTNITAGTLTTVTTLTNPVTLADGAHGGSSASLALGAGATISSSSGHAVTLTSSGSNGHGLLAQGHGTGSGIAASGGSTSGSGIYAVGDADGMGILAIGGDSALGLTAGLFLKSNAASNPVGLYVEDGAIITDDAGTALLVSSTGGDGDGVTITGNGSGGDLVADITGNLSGSVNSVTGDTKQTADVATLITTVGAAGAGLTALATQASVNTIDDFLDTEIAAILADTNELQTDWANGGRLDVILDTIAADTTTDLPALIADVPTVAEFEARTLVAANYFDPSTDGVNITKVNGVTVDGSGTELDPWGPAA